ncbi:sialic acid-binding Ig-like lectin 5 [Pseudophryne corroboree]|uniref:sialic acid-binding Ig-like lectin 5 n=1 Tax=Pseudophryne corroboree TaxID=495146 RepID=UPI00308131AC
MGSICAPSVANIYMGQWELETISGDLKENIIVYKRYIDDVLIVWKGTEIDWENFLAKINVNTYNLKFTGTFSPNRLEFLDLVLSTENFCSTGKIETYTHFKNVDSNSYLQFGSCHLPQWKENIPYSQYTRLRRNCTDLSKFDEQADVYTERFKERGYPVRLLDSAREKAKAKDRESLLVYKKRINKGKKLFCPMVTQFSTGFRDLEKIAKKNWHVLQMDAILGPELAKKTDIIYKKAKTLKSMLSKSALPIAEAANSEYKFLGTTKGFFSCCNCKVCNLAEKGSKTFQGNDTRKGPIHIKSFMNYITCQENPGYAIRADSPVTVEEGLCATIHCSFQADYRTRFYNSRGYWRIYDKPIVLATYNTNYVAKENFRMPGNLNEGDCTLTVTDARREDSGQYIFRFEESPTSRIKYNYEKSLISVNITDLTRMPEISIPEKIISGQEVTLTCSFPVDCPGTILNFQWSKSDQDGIWKNSSTVTFTPSQSDHNISVTCNVTLPTVMTSTQRTIILDVYYPPSIVIMGEINGKKNKKAETMTVLEGDSLRLICSVDSNPAANVTWMKEGDNVTSNETGRGLELHLTDVTASDPDTYYCVAESEYWRVNKSVTITVQYPPRKPDILISSSEGRGVEASLSMTVNEGETLTLKCTVDSNPAATVSWIKGDVYVDMNNMIGSGLLGPLISITAPDADTYRCFAWNKHGVIENRIKFNSNQGNKTAIENDSTSPRGAEYTIRDIMIGVACGIGIFLIVLLISNLIKRRGKVTNKTAYKPTEEQPPTEEQTEDPNQVYMNVEVFEKRPEIEESGAQLNLNSITADQEDMHYSTIDFPGAPSRVTAREPKTEYAEIKPNRLCQGSTTHDPSQTLQ